MEFDYAFSRRVQWRYVSLLLSSLYMLCNCCASRYDHKLMTPDCCGGGYNLTPLGCLLYGPWQTDLAGNNVAVYLDGKEISSIGTDYSEPQKDLVFELYQDGSVKFWFKSNYAPALKARALPDKNETKIVTDERPNDKEIGKIYTGGTWKGNFEDSSITINFGKEGDGIPVLKGKFQNLGSAYLDFLQTSFFDSTYLGNRIKLKKVITTHYNHPWIHNF